LVRIAPTDPRPSTATPTTPLGRSGLDLADLLATNDLVATRAPTGSVALEVGLEQSRGALLRNLPGDALSALDGVWEGARRTEEGWYLRSAALTVLGLPGECDRVAGEGLALKPTSLALRFVQSFARVVLGDLPGARAALQPALDRAPFAPLLQVQHALLHARQGDTRSAEAMLSKLLRAYPDHPAVVWGRSALRSFVADETRARSRPTPADWPISVHEDAVPSQRGTSARSTTPAAVDTIFEPIAEPVVDVASAALERFGARVAMSKAPDVAREARMLLRAFSAGGTLATATTPEQAHAARVVLTTFLGRATGDGADTPGPVRSLVEQLSAMIRDGRFDEAERLVRRQSAMAREPIGRLLLAVVRGASPDSARAPEHTSRAEYGDERDSALATSPTPAHGALLIRGETDRGPLISVRLGLGLLEETPQERNTPAVAAPMWNTPGSVERMDNPEESLAGWGAAHAAAPSLVDWSHGAGVRAVALLCVALAAGALVTGHGAIAIGLALGATWLGVRRSGRDARRADISDNAPHDAAPPQ
jgi:hypothetical protein